MVKLKIVGTTGVSVSELDTNDYTTEELQKLIEFYKNMIEILKEDLARRMQMKS